jgi:uncharacterized protein
MILEGVVSNVAGFGAFVDIGVHQDGLVHISAMSDRYVADPRDVVKPGDIVKVKVLDVDLDRKRVSLTLRLDDAPAKGGRSGQDERRRQRGKGRGRAGGSDRRDRGSAGDTAMGDALRRAGLI